MIKNNLKKKVMSGILAGSIITSLGITAFASELNQTQVKADKSIVSEDKENKGRHKGNIETILDKLVSDGKITQEKADSIKSYIETKRQENKNNGKEENKDIKERNKTDIIEELVESGILNSEEASLIRESQQEDRKQKEEDKFKKLEESGSFTSSEIAKIKNYLEDKKAERDEEREALKDKTEEERKAYFEQNKGQRKDMFSELVSDGIITQEQVDKLKETMPQKPQTKEFNNNQTNTDK